MRLEDILLRTVKRNFTKKNGFFFKREYFDWFFLSSTIFLLISSLFIDDLDTFFIFILLSQVAIAIPSAPLLINNRRLFIDDGHYKFYIYIQKNQFLSMLVLAGLFYVFEPKSQPSHFLPELFSNHWLCILVLSVISIFSLALMLLRSEK